jgi:hypothetical protein
LLDGRGISGNGRTLDELVYRIRSAFDHIATPLATTVCGPTAIMFVWVLPLNCCAIGHQEPEASL